MGTYTEYESLDEYCKGESSDKVLYINSDYCDLRLSTLTSLITNHFNDTEGVFEDYVISSEKVQFRCHYYDLYDDNDYGNVIVVEKIS